MGYLVSASFSTRQILFAKQSESRQNGDESVLMKKILIAGWGIGYPEGGGVQWFGMQYVAGLRALGLEVFWLDLLGSDRVEEHSLTPEAMIDLFRPQFDRFGLGDRWVVRYEDKISTRFFGMTEARLHGLCTDCDLLINLSGHLQDDELLRRIKRRAYFDLDPGFTQIWAHQVNMRLERFNLFFTVGLNVGKPEFAIPTRGIAWQPFVPPVSLVDWPVQTQAPSLPFTTVGQWRGEFASWENQYYGPKSDEFLQLIELPRKTSQPLELALLIHPTETEDIEKLQAHGWILKDPYQVACGIDGFQRYVQQSRGEFSVAKSAYVRLRSGWFSDRTVCYLASGRPALVQETGFGDHIPTGQGLLTFRTIDDAARGLDEIAANYEEHSIAARRIAEEVFAAPKVMHSIIARAGIS